MMPEDQKELQQFDNMRKQLKTQVSQMQMIAQDLYPQRQRNILSQFLHSLKDYPKVTAVMIEHQHKSISTLPSEVKKMFPELKERVGRSIEFCKKNAEFLEIVKVKLEGVLGLGYSRGYHQNEHQNQHQHQHQHEHKQQQTPQSNFCQHSHSHQVNPIKLINIFHHLCRQYSQQPIHKEQQFYIDFVRTTIKEYLNHQGDKNYLVDVENNKSIKTLVVGSGMGRCLVEIKRVYEEEEEEGKQKVGERVVQGHQQDPQHYLLAQYLLNHHNSNTSQSQSITQLSSLSPRIHIYPYIHNFSNHLYQQTPYSSVTINLPHINNTKTISPSSYPMTFGQFSKLYKSHSQEWNIIVTQFYNYSIKDVLLHVQLIYKLLKNNGIWIDISTSSFQNHIVPYMSYQEYEKILDKSQFTLVNKFNRKQLWYQQPNKLMNQWRKVYYRVMMKKSKNNQ